MKVVPNSSDSTKPKHPLLHSLLNHERVLLCCGLFDELKFHVQIIRHDNKKKVKKEKEKNRKRRRKREGKLTL
jgi:hypothetical protein